MLVSTLAARADDFSYRCAPPTADLSVVEPHNDDNRYFIVFLSRWTTVNIPTTLTGHAFVAFGEYDYSAKTCTFHAYGFYADDESVTNTAPTLLFGPVPGHIIEESEPWKGSSSTGSVGAASESRLIVEVPWYQYVAADNLRAAMSQTAQPYALASNDCITFVQTIARRIGLDVPERTGLSEFPTKYVEDLRKDALKDRTSNDFVGQMVHGVPAGWGTMTFPDGSKYTGYMAGGSPHYNGTYYAKNGITYSGIFGVNGPDVRGKYTFTDGSSYDGDISHGTLTGKGTYIWPNKDQYVGQFKNGFPDGSGKWTCHADGFTYEGDITNQSLTGHGLMHWADGSWYHGDVVRGKAQGEGAATYANHYAFQGPFDDGVPNGTGTIWYPNGRTETITIDHGRLPGGNAAPMYAGTNPGPIIQWNIGQPSQPPSTSIGFGW